MVVAQFTEEMINKLSEIKGKRFISFECEKGDGFSRAFGNIRMNFEDCSIELINDIEALPFYDSIEDIAVFSCKEVDSNVPFIPMVITETRIVPVDEVVKSIRIINDEIVINDGDYSITMDVGLVIDTESQTYMFSKGIWFSEIISISYNDDINSIYPIESVINDWNNDGEDKVIVNRTEQTL